jgi:uncharacterized membrane protein
VGANTTSMTMPPRLRKAVLTAHVATSVGWLGALIAYLVLDITATASEDPATTRSAYLAMDLLVRYAIVPLAVTALLVAVVNALGTPWGLFRHYWVLAKLVLVLVATTVLLVEAPTVAQLADQAASTSDPRGLPGTLPHSVGGLAVLLSVLALSVYKPRGLTRYGWRRQQRQRAPTPPTLREPGPRREG